MLPLGAFDKQTGDYVFPTMANKINKHICTECNKDLILCQGKIRAHHFRHKVDSVNPCYHYSNPTETQIHKDGKMVMRTLLERKIPISFIRNCGSCKKNEEYEIPEMTETSKIELECRFEYNGTKIADVAYIDDSDIVSIFEICNTHKTCSESRPEPWFEIDAETLIKLANDNSMSRIKIPCIRCEKCEHCNEAEREKKRKIRADVESKSSSWESDSYSCLSDEYMHILIPIISGDDAYEQWSAIYRHLYAIYSGFDYNTGEGEKGDLTGWAYDYKEMEENIKLGQDNARWHCSTYYNDNLILDIQKLQLYKYFKCLRVWHGQITIKFDVCDCQIDIDDAGYKLITLCKELFGVPEEYIEIVFYC
jgi:uncharacterized protein YkuJ